MRGKIPLQVIDDGANSLYASERKIYPREVRGRLDTLRRIAVFVLLGMYYLFPWLSWNGRQAVLFDLPARKFYIFGLNFWPQDFIFLAMLLIIAGLALFFFTALAGRLWCGYACPQTVWTETFLWMEHWLEGDRNKRMKLDQLPWSNPERLRKSGSKHVLWLLFALWTGFTFVGFFTPIRELFARAPLIAPGWQWGGWETFWVFFYALATWGNAGFLREQVCKYMCPYARFQSAMFDRNTLIIAYDPLRGEPRGPRKRGMGGVTERARGLLDKLTAYDFVARASQHPVALENAHAARLEAAALADAPVQAGPVQAAPMQAASLESVLLESHAAAAPLPKFPPEQLGDCIDCTICVQVCPTGIDIRDGLQYECIACGACVDACDEVMDKMGYPRGLIRYSTQNAIDGKPSRVLRPRILLYGALLLAVTVAWGWGVTHRSTLIAEVLRDRNALYREVAGGAVENGYTLRLVNKTDAPRAYRIGVDGPPGAVLQGAPAQVQAQAEEVLTLPVTVRAPAGTRGKHALRFEVQTVDGGETQVIDSSFFGPAP